MPLLATRGDQRSPLSPCPRSAFVLAVLVGQLEFVEWTPDDHLRHTKFVALRDDKSARDVTREFAISPDGPQDRRI